ncbi:MAG: Stp1/IreP family PP2C-type Ser/Thr phosphatase [Verrucomicrobia bacterium]|nr:Stp1/IreP family PP2C-type Ser/Thr phosphatase [Verrucomicrobiota bacterium]
MKLMQYQTDSFGMTDVGHIRTNNEDVFEIVADKQFFILADGMGGHNAGEVASSEAVKSLCRSIRYAPVFSSEDQITKYLLQAVEKANQRVWNLSLEDDAFSGMGTTISCFLVHEDCLVYAHMGDSRLYQYRNKLVQISHDHSLRALLLEEEDIDRELLEQPGFKNVITRALGTHPQATPDIEAVRIQAGDIYLLCTDGLTDLVSDAEIASILSSGKNLEKTCESLISAALEKGGNDNITVLMVKILSPA